MRDLWCVCVCVCVCTIKEQRKKINLKFVSDEEHGVKLKMPFL